MPKIYELSESVEQVANSLIPNYHPDLATVKIAYLVCDTESKRNGKPVLGTTRKLSAEMKVLSSGDYDFVITVPLPIWNDMPNERRAAMLDSLLERISAEENQETGDVSLKVRQPDVQEFTSILQRHGAWNESLVDFVSTASEIGVGDNVQVVAPVRQTTRNN
jgi:hypothetical protein